jgi:ferric-dicitrate binding protein FerR (iron transport regulator)
VWLWAATCGLLAAIGCRCTSAEVVARLTQVQGAVARDEAPSVGIFQPAAPGAELHLGEAVKTGPAASAELSLDDDSRILLQENTLLRFLSAPPTDGAARALDVETGLAELQVGPSRLRLSTQVGLAELDSGTRLRIVSRAGGLSFTVLLGLARFETLGGPRHIVAGQELSVTIGGAVLESPRASPAAEAVKAPAEVIIAAKVEGKGVRARAPGVDTWQALKPGATELAAGSSLQLDAAALVQITSPASGITLRGRGAFIVAADNAPFVRANAGRMTVAPSASPVSVAVPGGTLVVWPESHAELSIGGNETTSLRVGAGKVEVQSVQGGQVIEAGEDADLTKSGRLRILGRGPSYADMLAPAGTSFVVHDPRPATSIRFLLQGVCALGGIVERLSTVGERVLSSARGEAAASLLFPAGTHRYRVRCLELRAISERAAASGSVTVVKDSGTGELSRVSPMTHIDMDGRSYLVMYQNLLPKIAVSWQGAPKAARYTLNVESRLSKRSVSSVQPSHTFAPGQLQEGNYVLQFRAETSTSPLTKLTVRFENAAPAARISSPRDGTFQPGESVTVAGIAIPGWTVSVDGRQLELDAEARFSVQTQSSLEQRAVQIRFEHPLRGVRYYLRRTAGSPP